MSATRKIPLHPSIRRFAQGVTAAQRVLDEHKDVEFPDLSARLALFWFYVGALAAGEYRITEQEDFEHFILGVTTRAPHRDEEEGED